jgi:hypothetical protein
VNPIVALSASVPAPMPLFPAIEGIVVEFFPGGQLAAGSREPPIEPLIGPLFVHLDGSLLLRRLQQHGSGSRPNRQLLIASPICIRSRGAEGACVERGQERQG